MADLEPLEPDRFTACRRNSMDLNCICQPYSVLPRVKVEGSLTRRRILGNVERVYVGIESQSNLIAKCLFDLPPNSRSQGLTKQHSSTDETPARRPCSCFSQNQSDTLDFKGTLRSKANWNDINTHYGDSLLHPRPISRAQPPVIHNREDPTESV
jgi:hypothetical protein